MADPPDPRMPGVLDPESKVDMRTANQAFWPLLTLLGVVNPSSSGQGTGNDFGIFRNKTYTVLACAPILTAGQCNNSGLS